MQATDGDGGRDFDFGIQIEFDERSVDVFHGGYEVVRGVVWVDEDFVSDSNGFDLCRGVEFGDFGLDPIVGKCLVGGGRGEEFIR